MKMLASICLIAFFALVVQTAFTAETQRSDDVAQRLPLIYWPQGAETAQALKQAGIDRIAAPPDKADEWRKVGFKVVAISQAELQRRQKLLTPRIAGRADVASATRRPWIDANGWRFLRNPSGKFYYELPQGRAPLAAAEAFAYKADAFLRIDAADLEEAGKMLTFLRTLPQERLSEIADIAVIDDGSDVTGEVMNLLTRRNLLFKIVPSLSPQFRLNIKLGTKQYPKSAAADPSGFAQKIRRQLGDESRSLRIYGTEMVIGKLEGDGARARLHLLNYSGREADGIRVRLRGKYGKGEIKAFGFDGAALEDFLVTGGATEFSISKLGIYALVDLPVAK
jgi:hypothetical protein